MSFAATDTAPPSVAVPGTRLWRSLGARLSLWYVAVMLAAFAVVGSVVALRADSRVVHEGAQVAERRLADYRRALEEHGIEGVRELAGRDAREHASVAARVTQHEAIVLTVASDAASDEAARQMGTRDDTWSRASAWPRREWQLAGARVSHDRIVEVVVRNDAGLRMWRDLRDDVALVAVVAVLCAVVGAFLISRRALAPFGELAHGVDAIVRSGDLSRRVPERGTNDELDRVAALFNRMLTKNEGLVRAMRESLDNVAHDLRTPLTRLRSGAELALGSPDEVARREALADAVEESDRVLGMLTALMDIAEADAGAMKLALQREDLAAIAREAVDLYDLVSADKGVHVVTSLTPGVEVFVDRRRILQAIANLLDNAIKYTPPEGRVEVVVEARGREGVVLVRDSGIGIAPEDQPRVWERLFRGDRSRAERGLGLGLSLVRAVVEAHGGRVALQSELERGATFELRLPRRTPSR